MKFILKSIIALAILLLPSISLAQTVDIKTAIAKKIISYKISGSWDIKDKKIFLDPNGQYFGKCMNITLRSKADTTLIIFIDKGLMLMCEDTATQDMVVTKPAYVELSPGSSEMLQLYAMCSEYHDGMPHTATAYKIGNMADSNLVAIVNVIDDMLMHNMAGQGAVWAYRDQIAVEDLQKYGATSNSIFWTIEILNRAKVSTKLHPISAAVSDSLPTITTKADSVIVIEEAKVMVGQNELVMKSYVVYTGAGIILLLLGTTLYLLLRKNNTEKVKPS